jgi:hypothetical protein
MTTRCAGPPYVAVCQPVAVINRIVMRKPTSVSDTTTVLEGERASAGAATPVTIELHDRLDMSRWSAVQTGGQALVDGDRLRFGDRSNRVCLLGTLHATVAGAAPDGTLVLAFEFYGSALDEMIAALAAD